VPGDSLLGITVDDLLRAFSGKKVKKALTGDDPPQNQLPFFFARGELEARLHRAFRHLHEIERLETEQPGDFEDQQLAWFTMRQELADFLDAHRLRIGRAFLEDTDPAADPLLANRWMQEIQDQHVVSEKTRTIAGSAIAKGNEVRALCWELVFPELFFEPAQEGQGVQRRERPGFDAMLGNPPWDKIRPYQKEFFARFDPAIRDFQGQSLKRRIGQLAPLGSEPLRLWHDYNALQTDLAFALTKGGIYAYQVVEVNGEKTGGDPDLFKLFLERFHQLSRQGGRVAVLMPAGLYALEGVTGLRQLLFSRARVEAIYSFENWGKRFFQIHASFKFLTLVFEKQEAQDQSFPAAFMLRDEGFLAAPEQERAKRSVKITGDFIRLTNPAYSAIVELRDDREREFVERIYRSVPPLARKLSGAGRWNVEFHRELDMTDDAWRFHRRDWLVEYECRPDGSAFVAPPAERYKASDGYVPGIRYIVPDGTKYRITSLKPLDQDKKKGSRGQRLQFISGFLRRDRATDEHETPIVPGARYLPLYEGRLVHQYDHAAKAYLSGEGRGAKWDDLSFEEKQIVPHYRLISETGYPLRAGFCRVTGQTNERSMLASLLPASMPSGHSLATAVVDQHPELTSCVLLAFLNSMLVDFLLRQKISTNMTLYSVETCPIIRPLVDSIHATHLSTLVSRLVSITPEIQLAEPALDLRERARLRAEIDAIVAGLYDLSPTELGHILTTFPLLDRDQPPLPCDFFVRWNKQGKPKFEPRSYVTRDTALLAYFRHRSIAPPDDLAAWYRDEVAVDMLDDEFCPFRMGPIRNLEQRVAEAHRRGAIAYVPSKAKKWDPNGPYQPLSLAAG
jgi:hypothetical protein